MMAFGTAATVAAIISGILSHVFYFRKGEHHMYGATYVQAFGGFAIAAFAFQVLRLDKTVRDAIDDTSWLPVFYLVGVYSSLVVYRLFFHPLKSFPGPLPSKLSSLWLSILSRHAQAYRPVAKLHEKYGRFVRVGSNDLSIAHPKAVEVIYGTGSKCIKAAWYDLTRPMVSLQTMREKEPHQQRRRVWGPVLGDKALRGYEKRIKIYRQKLLSRLEELNGAPVNFTRLINMYSFDVMGDLAFGKSFDMLETNEAHWGIRLLKSGLHPLAFLLPMWFFRILTAIPALTRDWWAFIEFCASRVEQRMKEKVETPDFMSALLAPLQNPPTPHEMDVLRGDSQLAIIAGSDSTASTLSSAIYQLIKNPKQLIKLREELSASPTDALGEFQAEKLAVLEHLNGVINETLRLYPVVPTAMQRKTPPEGIYIDEVYIPGDMTVWTPQYVLGRDETIFEKPLEFVPERWYKNSDMVKDKSAHFPFSIGQYSCIGKPLAMMHIRSTLAHLVMQFDFTFASGEDGRNYEDNLTEHFISAPGDVSLSFRKKGGVN